MPKGGQTLESSGSGDSMSTSRGGGSYNLSSRIRLLRNKIFYERYIMRNARSLYSSLLGLNSKPNLVGRTRLLRWMVKLPLGLYCTLYFIARFLCGKVDMPKFEIVVTTKCTLRCEACANLMQYFDKDTHYTCTLSGIVASLETLFKVVGSVQTVNVLGGEPLLHKELAGLLRYLRESPKVKSFVVVTNGTLDFKEDVLDALEGTSKARVIISDYSMSPNLAVPLKHESIIASLEKRNIEWRFSSATVQKKWHDPDRRYKRGRPKEEVIRNFRACMMDCVSVMSGEGLKDASLAPLGAAFVCPVASALSRLKGLAEFEGDFIDFATATRERIIEFYAQDYFKACDYCHDMWAEKRFITPAVQTREVFRVEELS